MSSCVQQVAAPVWLEKLTLQESFWCLQTAAIAWTGVDFICVKMKETKKHTARNRCQPGVCMNALL